MEINYWLYAEDFKKHSDVLDKEQAVQMSIMDQKEKVWTKATIMLYQKPAAEAFPVGLLGPFGEPFEQGKYYIKILEMLPEEEE